MTLLKLIRWELYKLSRQRSSYVGFVLCLGFAIVMMVGFGFSKWRYLKSYKNLPFDPMDLINGPFFAHFSLQIGFVSILPLLAATLGGSQIAGEAKDGTLRALLVRPPSRALVYTAKAVATWVWLQMLVFFLVAFSLMVGAVAYGGGDLLIFIWEFRKDGPWLVDAGDIWALFFVVSLGAGTALFVIGALSLMLTTMTDSPVVAHVGTLGAFFISSVIQRMPEQLMAEEIREALPTTHMSFWLEFYRLWDPVPGAFDPGRIAVDVVWCIGFYVLFLGTGLWWFTRKDVTS